MDPTSKQGYFTRSKIALEFKAAGVLPFCILPSGEALALLGAETSRTGPNGRMRKTMCEDYLLSPLARSSTAFTEVDIVFEGSIARLGHESPISIAYLRLLCSIREGLWGIQGSNRLRCSGHCKQVGRPRYFIKLCNVLHIYKRNTLTK